jgi:type II secretory pathway pseudopilin PulG
MCTTRRKKRFVHRVKPGIPRSGEANATIPAILRAKLEEEDIVKCHACGQDNADRALFCTGCRRPLVAPTKAPARLEPMAAPAGGGYASASASPGMADPFGGGMPRGGAGAAPSQNRYAPPNEATVRQTRDEDAGLLTEAEAWGAIIGNSSTSYYLERFERLATGGSASWHWPALFVTWYWLLYRKMWLGALIYFFAPGILMSILGAIAPKALAPVVVLLGWAAMFIVPAVMANGWYFRHCEKKIADVRARGGSKEQMLARMESVGGTSNIIVIIIGILGAIMVIGILAAVALPAYQSYTIKAKVSGAMTVGRSVAQAVGDQYEKTGTLPSSTDLDLLVAKSGPQAKTVKDIGIDPATGAITIKVPTGPSSEGAFELVPSADNNRHLTWSCVTDDPKFARSIPASADCKLVDSLH